MPQTSAGNRGNQCVVAYGDVLHEEQCYDQSTQLELGADDYLWDGEYDFSIYENEVEVDVSSSDFIWEDSGYDAAEVETCFDAGEVAACFDDEVEDCNSYQERKLRETIAALTVMQVPEGLKW